MPGSQNTTPRKSTRGRWEWLRRYGRPLAHYTDKNSIFRTSAAALLGEQLRGEKARSHFGRALGELGIEWIAAHSPQAKGRIERLFETLQDRLVFVPGSRGPLYESRLTNKVRCESIEFRNGFLRPIRRQCIRDGVRGR